MIRGDRVLIERRRLGMKQDVLAKRANVHRSYISQIENEVDVKPSVEVLVALADALGVTVNYLLGLSDNPLPDDAHTLAESAVVYEVDSISQRRRVQRMLDLFTALDETGQEMALRLMETVRDTYQPRIIGNDS